MDQSNTCACEYWLVKMNKEMEFGLGRALSVAFTCPEHGSISFTVDKRPIPMPAAIGNPRSFRPGEFPPRRPPFRGIQCP
jgi:hypothetical protein